MESTSSHEVVEVYDLDDEPIIIASAAEAAGRIVDMLIVDGWAGGM
jgi:hypothetical protein